MNTEIGSVWWDTFDEEMKTDSRPDCQEESRTLKGKLI